MADKNVPYTAPPSERNGVVWPNQVQTTPSNQCDSAQELPMFGSQNSNLPPINVAVAGNSTM